VTLSPDYKKGVSLMNTRHDSAYYYLNKAATESKDSLQIAQAYNMMAVLQNRDGDYYGGQESLLASLKYLHADRENDQYCLVADYNVLGNTSLNLKNYDAAIRCYDSAYRFAKAEKSKAIALNNKAKTYQEMGKYVEAAAIYESILPQSRQDRKDFARVLCNLASVRWLYDPRYRAAPDLLQALRIRREEQDQWGMNSSYSHLADYYMYSRPDSALVFAREMYGVASWLGSPDDQLEALEKLIALGPTAEVKTWFARYRQMKDSLETARNGAKNQFALIRYDVEKNKADNLRLQRENAERRVEVVRQRAIGIGTGIVFLVLVIWGIGWYRKRKRRLEWEKETAIREDRLQTSQKVHDVVANGLYRVMTEIEYGEEMDREQLLDKIEFLYVQSRDISYEPFSSVYGDFQPVVAGLLLSFGSAERKVLIMGNDKSLWAEVGQETKRVLEPVLQELMVNMDKHSEARNVVVRFEREGKGVVVLYMDDGVGLPVDVQFGNGLANTGNRISAMGGRITFERNAPGGARIRIYLPNADPL